MPKNIPKNMPENIPKNISKIILNGTEYVIKDAATQYHTINGQAITGGTGDITITGGSGLKKWEGTRAEYNALSSYDTDTLYIITDEDVEIPTVPTKVSAFENNAGYLTQHQDLSGYALKSNSEEITFTLEDGSTVTKKFVLG